MSKVLYSLLLLIFSSSWAQVPRNINAQDLISFPSIRSVELHQDQEIIVYELRETKLSDNKYRHHLWVTKTDGSNNRQFTYSSADEWDPDISPDGHCVAFFSDRPDDDGKSATRIWAMSLSGGEAKPLTDPDRDIISFKWSADGSTIYYLTPAIEQEQAKTWTTQRAESGFDATDRTSEKPKIELWKVDKSNCTHERLFVGDPGVYEFDVDPSGNTLVYETNYSGDDNDWVETDLFLFSLRDSIAIKQLTTAKGSEGAPAFSPNGNLIAYDKPQDPRKPFSQIEVEVISLDGTKPVRLTKDLDLHISGFKWYHNQALLLEVNQGMSNHIYTVSLDGVSTELTGGAAYFFRSATDPGSQSIAAARQTANSLTELVYTQGPGHPWKVLTNHSEKLNELMIHPQTSYSWLSRDDRYRLEGLVVLPHFSGHDPLPLIVDIHGGPASRTDIALEQFALYQAWASQGFAVFSPNFRGSEGYGAAFQVANYRDFGGGDYHDIMSGVKDLIRRGVAHPDSLVIMGGSYGGYMTNWVITQTNRFKAAVSRYGIFDLKSDFSNSNYAQWELDYLGKPYWEAPSLYRKMSPSAFIKKAKTPTLILHGADDENTFTSNSRELARALETLDVPHRFLLYPREGHGMHEPSHRLDVFEKQLSWVNFHLGRRGALSGEDWLSPGIRVQVLSADYEAEFLNAPGERFIAVKLLLDASRIQNSQHLTLSDFQLGPDHDLAIGFPSGQFLAPLQMFSIELEPKKGPVELELVFPQSEVPNLFIMINGIGSYALPL